jgi:hypothetical protein
MKLFVLQIFLKIKFRKQKLSNIKNLWKNQKLNFLFYKKIMELFYRF